MFVLPIGGADMPVVISLLNAFTGLAASATGFVLDSTVLIVAGMLVGASGTLLTLLMAKAMNRSIANVLFGAFGQVQAGAGQARADDGRTVRATTADDVAVQLSFARKVVVVPGYGMAVAQAQHDVRQLADVLEERGVDVKYAIHPVAGRMPGHMNVLLAEANVPYTQLFEMDEINPEFPQTDVALVIGANDVTNPAARSDPASPIYGMPILDVDKAASIVVMKRSMNPGFAGIDNDLYLDPKTTMLFGDAKESVLKLISAVKSRSVIPVFRAADVERAVSPHEAYDAVRAAFEAHARGDLVDAVEGLRHELPGRRLPRDARDRRRPRAAQVGHVVPGEPRARAADGHRARAPLRRRGRAAAGGARRRRRDCAADRRRRRARRGHALPLGGVLVRRDRLRRQRRRDGADARRARRHAARLGRRRGPAAVRGRAARRPRRRERGRGARREVVSP